MALLEVASLAMVEQNWCSISGFGSWQAVAAGYAS